jgi:hypothetical protein
LDVLAIHDHFSQLKLKVSAETGSVRVVEFKYPGAKRLSHNYPILLTALAPVTYYQQHPPFSLMGFIFGNPTILMMVFSLAVIVFFPMLLSGLSEEELKELQSSGTGDPMTSLQRLMGVEPQKEAAEE